MLLTSLFIDHSCGRFRLTIMIPDDFRTSTLQVDLTMAYFIHAGRLQAPTPVTQKTRYTFFFI